MITNHTGMKTNCFGREKCLEKSLIGQMNANVMQIPEGGDYEAQNLL